MTKEQILKSLAFGSVDSESEENLDKIFIQTENFDEFLNPNTALLLGCKGAGKSALFRLFAKYESSARKMAGHRADDVYFVSGIGFKDVAEMDDMKLLNQIESGTISSEAAWKIYITYKLIYSLYDNYKIICGENGRRVLQKAGVVPDHRITALARKLYRKFVGEPPRINQIDFSNISISLSENNSVPIYDLLGEINSFLSSNGETVWLLLDKIDELFPGKTDVRKECIEGLFLAYIDFVARYSNIRLKIFLRTDIWNTLSFVNKSHLTDKTTVISWKDDALKRLLIKRAVYSDTFEKFLAEKIGSSDFENNIDACFSVIFPNRVYPGSREAKTMDWMIERAKDGLGGVYPREIINFANLSVKEELRNTSLDEIPDFNKSLISGLSIRNAFPNVSQIKVDSYLSEFASLTNHFKRFNGQQTAEYSQSEFFDLMKGLIPSGEEMIQEMHETGVIAFSSGQSYNPEAKIIVPRLFRSGLGIVTMGRP